MKPSDVETLIAAQLSRYPVVTHEDYVCFKRGEIKRCIWFTTAWVIVCVVISEIIFRSGF